MWILYYCAVNFVDVIGYDKCVATALYVNKLVNFIGLYLDY